MFFVFTHHPRGWLAAFVACSCCRHWRNTKFFRDHKIFAQKKQGFALPIARLMKGKLLPHLQELKTSDSYESNLVNRDCLESLIDNHINNRSNFSRILYNFLVFAAWRKKYPNLSFS